MTLCASTPSVKGIYTALFILILSTSAFAQIELKDTTYSVPFHKWEIGFDLKPLFRSDEPYNIFIKRYLKESRALRLGLFSSDAQFYDDSLNISEIKLTPVRDIFQYWQSKRNKYKSFGFEIRLGYQFEFKKGAVSIYTATDLSYNAYSTHLIDGGGSQSGDTSQVKPFEGYNPFIGKNIKIKNYGFLQSMGVKYYLCRQLSIGVEATVRLTYSTFSFNYRELPYVDLVFLKETTLKGHSSNVSFVPLMGLYLNYYF